ncbi:MAG: patatin family protein [Firmicutes bacterium]|nr:patatin family protein [Bacillota bacterium]
MEGEEPKIGLALGAGALRGLCHLGLLQVFREENIPVSFVAGTSIGAVMGAFFAAGKDLQLLIDVAKHLRLRHLVDPIIPREGIIHGKKITELLHLFLQDITFAELQIPLAVVATDLQCGTEVVLQKGSVVDAVRASISIPGIFTPVIKDGQILVDGCLVNRVPIDTVRKMGAEKVIAVSILLPPLAQQLLKNVADIILQSFDVMQLQLTACKTQRAEIVIEPNVAKFSPARLDSVEECIQEGAEAARRALPQIRALLQT